MASSSQPRILTFKATAAISKGQVVKPGATREFVTKSAAATSKNMGIAQSDALNAGDPIEVAIQGGGGKALLGGSVSFGDYLTSDGNGALVATTTATNVVVAQAMEDGSAGDIIGVEVVSFLI